MIPRPALILGLSGVLPFAILSIALHTVAQGESHDLARAALTLYAVTILSFMSGCIWAFSAKTGDVAGYALSVLPALFGYFTPLVPVYYGWATIAESQALLSLAFAVLLLLDWRAARRKQTPSWWIKLRLLLTTLVVIFLSIGATA